MVEAALIEPLRPVSGPDKPSCWQRYNLGQEFLRVGILDDEQAALEFLKVVTVSRAGAGKYDESVVPKANEGLRRSQ